MKESDADSADKVENTIYTTSFLTRRLETWVDIEAPVDRVWKDLVDFASWEKWNAFIPTVEGKLEEGEVIEIKVVPPGLKPMIFRPKVFEVRENKRINWGGGFLVFVYQGNHEFVLEKLDDQKTRFRQIETFRGPMVLLMKTMIEKTALGYAEMNGALKNKIEKSLES